MKRPRIELKKKQGSCFPVRHCSYPPKLLPESTLRPSKGSGHDIDELVKSRNLFKSLAKVDLGAVDR